VPVAHLFDGFASNAVISIIAVMIIGAGLDRTGIMSQVAAFIMRIGGSTETRIIPLISGTVGVISSFMQNVGAAALFLPVVSRISARTKLPMSRLLMPMGFCAILGGTITMVGSSPLILLNDLILTSNKALPDGVAPMRTFQLFDVTPIGLALLATGIVYFVLAGRFVLPSRGTDKTEAKDPMAYYGETYGYSDFSVHEVSVPRDCRLVGTSVDDMERHGMCGWSRSTRAMARAWAPPASIAASASRPARPWPCSAHRSISTPSSRDRGAGEAGRRDLLRGAVIEQGRHRRDRHPAGLQPGRQVRPRRLAAQGLRAVGAGHPPRRRDPDLRDRRRARPAVQARRHPVVHTTWVDLARLEKDRDFVVVTTEYPHEELRPHKVPMALLFFAITLGLVLLTDLRCPWRC
jgi:di/tricarboxylate transporter